MQRELPLRVLEDLSASADLQAFYQGARTEQLKCPSYEDSAIQVPKLRRVLAVQLWRLIKCGVQI
jgi:hypothetical protein